METDLSEYHKGTDGLYYADYIAPNKAETFMRPSTTSRPGHLDFTLPKSALLHCFEINIPVSWSVKTGMFLKSE